jgi:flavin reductase (DIM6/NTAB) family NADH-FMN oxidoreductase RutF
MEFIHYDLEGEKHSGINHRWVQPPQIAYFVTTVDRFGNVNVTPVTMGTSFAPPHYYVFCLSNLFVPDWDGEYKPGIKQGYMNLKEVPECVISYYGHDLVRESWIVGMPIPKGINEMDVASLTPLPSQKVAPPGIAECPVNMECRIIATQKVGSRWTLYTCAIVGVSVSADFVARDKTEFGSMGVLGIDPVFEVKIAKGDTPETSGMRLYYNRMDFSRIERCPEDVGCENDWIGSFDQWLQDEQKRGKLTEEERLALLDLDARWAKDRNPATNGAVKLELTARLKKLVQKP